MTTTRIEALVFCLLFSTPTRADVKSSYYKGERDFDNKTFQNRFLTENPAESLIACSVMCSESRKICGCFGYNSKKEKCRLHETCNTEQSAVYEEGWRNYCPDVPHIPRDCSAILQSGRTESGVYKIYPFSTRCHAIRVYCDMETAGGGWTAFQRRLHWSVKFNRTWEEYKIGFGIPEVDYWIGNDVIHQLTKGINSSLHVVIKLPTGETLYELYDHFSIADEANKYKLFLEGPATGTLGDSLLVGTQNLNGMYFSTLDQDNDVYPAWHCGAGMGGGWWFRNCCYAFLNGAWFSGSFGVSWFPKLPAGSKANETLIMAFQRRLHWFENFNWAWEDYKVRFGTPGSTYWIGNDVIHQLTKGINSSLHVVIKLPTGETLYELYDQFSIADETIKCKLFLGRPATGTLGTTDFHGPLKIVSYC